MEESTDHTKHFTAFDIEKYHKGLLSPGEMNAMEKAALEDPLLADAMEGYSHAGLNLTSDLDDLRRRLEKRPAGARVIPIGATSSSSFKWWRAAAVILFLAGAGLFSYMYIFRQEPGNIAQRNNQRNPAQPPAASPEKTVAVPDSPVHRSGDASQPETANVNANPVTLEIPSKKSTAENQQPVAEDRPAADSVANGDAAQLLTRDQLAKASNRREDAAIAEEKRQESKERIAAKRKNEAEQDKLDETVVSRYATITPPVANRNAGNNLNYFRGRITDENNNALPFSNVTNLSDNVGTYTDARGYFTLVSTDSVMDVQIRSLGFENNRTRLRSNAVNNQVTMREDQAVTARVLDTVKRNYARVRDGNLTFEEPEPEDGWASYDTYLANNLNVPANFDVRKSELGDVVELSFDINKDGQPVNIKVVKSLCEKCDQEAIRLIKQGPKWKRKSRKGKTTVVKVPFVKTAG